VIHPARFLLVGSMNPEEGDLRPQLLDRFGLMVNVTGSRDPALRAEIVRRRLDFEADPVGFEGVWANEQLALRERILATRTMLPHVVLDDGLLSFITRLCCELEVDGLRADLVLHKTARTLAAWHGRQIVTLEDVRNAAEFVLPHRRRRKPFERPELDRERLDKLCAELQQEKKPDPQHQVQAGGPQLDGTGETSAQEQTFEPTSLPPPRPLEIAPLGQMPHSGRGRRNAVATHEQGQYVRAVPDKRPPHLALDATLRAAVSRGGHQDGKLEVAAADLHRQERSGRTGTLILFVVDSSGSMAARQRMTAVKGAVLSLLQSAYEQRDRVGVVAFRGIRAEVLLPPTGSVELAERALRELPSGGRTPLAHALMLAHGLVRRERRARPEQYPLLVLLSDGRANIALPDEPGDAWQQSLQMAREVASAGVPALILDTETGYIRLGRGQELAQAMMAEHMALEELSAETLTLTIRERSQRFHC
jgi:magnesium chelatase subunit D